VVPEARGAAQRQIEEASAYKEEVIANAEGEAERFSLLLAEYRNAPEVTRERLYIDAVQKVLGNTNKVMIDVEGGNNMMYLPLDQLTSKRGTQTSRGATLDSNDLRDLTNAVTEQIRRDAAAASNNRRGGR
jgi:membrane protease subunit HflK